MPNKSVLPRFYPTWSLRTMQALHEKTKVRGPWVEASTELPKQVSIQPPGISVVERSECSSELMTAGCRELS